MKRARKHTSNVIKEIEQRQDPLVAARIRKKMSIAAIIEDAMNDIDFKKGELADKLDKYNSEITRWLSGTHNFTVDSISDIEEILQIKILPDYKEKKTQQSNKHLRPIEASVVIGEDKIAIDPSTFKKIKDLLTEEDLTNRIQNKSNSKAERVSTISVNEYFESLS